jgi:hypothetical protein
LPAAKPLDVVSKQAEASKAVKAFTRDTAPIRVRDTSSLLV